MVSSIPLLAAAGALTMGIALAWVAPAPRTGVCLALAALSLLLATVSVRGLRYSRHLLPRRLLLGLGCVWISLSLAGLAAGRLALHPSRGLASHPGIESQLDSGFGVRLAGTVRGFPSIRDRDLMIDLEVDRVEGVEVRETPGRIRLAIRNVLEEGTRRVVLWPGDRLALSASLRRLRQRGAPGAARQADQLRRDGIALRGTVKTPKLIRLLPTPASDTARLIARLRGRLSDALRATMEPWEPTGRGILAALVVGERSDLDPLRRQQLQRAGSAHLLAISGMHVGLVVWLLLRLARAAGCAQWVALWGVLAFLPLYVALTGMRPSAVRAGWMAAAWILGRLLARASSSLNALGFAGIIALLISPAAIWQLGLQLSFLATAGIIVFTPRLEKSLRGPRWLCRAISASLASTLAVAPVLARKMYWLAPVGIITNVAAVPLAAVALTAGWGAVLLELLLPGAGRWPAWVALEAVQGLLQISVVLGRVPGGNWATPGPTAEILGAYYVLLGALAFPWTTGLRRLLLVGFLAAGACVLAGAPGTSPDGVLEVHVLDVGQGDAILVRGPGDTALLIDGGGAVRSSFDIGARVVAPALWGLGVRRLDLVVGTHGHRDHLGGLSSVLERIPAEEVWLPERLRGSSHADVVAIRRTCAKHAVPIRWVHRGRRSRWGRLSAEVLHPAAGSRRRSDPNHDSLVVRLIYGQRCFLLTGDAGHQVEEMLAERGDPGRCDVLKVGHHGSRGATSKAFLGRVRPSLGAISAGRGNPWGHPHDDVVRRLEDQGTRAWRTDRNGTIRFETDGRWVRWAVSDL